MSKAKWHYWNCFIDYLILFLSSMFKWNYFIKLLPVVVCSTVPQTFRTLFVRACIKFCTVWQLNLCMKGILIFFNTFNGELLCRRENRNRQKNVEQPSAFFVFRKMSLFCWNSLFSFRFSFIIMPGDARITIEKHKAFTFRICVVDFMIKPKKTGKKFINFINNKVSNNLKQ